MGLDAVALNASARKCSGFRLFTPVMNTFTKFEQQMSELAAAAMRTRQPIAF
jgi:hypothetical protein